MSADRAPRRIRLSRAKGWRKPEGAVVVGRPSKWGNPFRVVHGDDGEWYVVERDEDGDDLEIDYAWTRGEARALAVAIFQDTIDPREGEPSPSEGMAPDYPSREDIRAELRGRDLACWCPLDQPCHADVLLEIANGPTP